MPCLTLTRLLPPPLFAQRVLRARATTNQKDSQQQARAAFWTPFLPCDRFPRVLPALRVAPGARAVGGDAWRLRLVPRGLALRCAMPLPWLGSISPASPMGKTLSRPEAE